MPRNAAPAAALPRLAGSLATRIGQLPDAVAADLDLAARSALLGGLAVLERYGAADLDVDDPTGRGPVTAADRAAHRAILGILEDERPGDAVLSEEGRPAETAGELARLWVVDPLDGTREFIDGIGEFSVMVGLAVDGEAVLGAVHRPVPDVLCVGAVGHGAWRIEAASTRPEAAPLEVPDASAGPPRLVRSRSHPDPRLAALEEALGDVEVVLSGSAGTKCCLVAEGRVDLYVHPVPYLKEWDTCAPEALLLAAGGRVTDCFGGRLAYGKSDPVQPRGLFAAAPGVHDRVAGAVSRAAEGL